MVHNSLTETDTLARTCTIKHYGFVIYTLRIKLVRLSKPMKVTDNRKDSSSL